MEKRGRKRKRKSFVQQAQKFGKSGRFGKGSHIEQATYDYFVTVLKTNSESNFTTEDEKELFVNNVFEETVGNEVNLASNQLVSRVIETLLPWISDEGFKRFTDAFSESFRPICSDPFASYVLQKLVVVATERIRKSSNPDTESTDVALPVEEIYTAWLIKVSRFCLNNLEDFVWDTYANHIIRTSLECLAGLEPGITVGRSKKWGPQQPHTGEGKETKLSAKAKPDNVKIPEVNQELIVEYAKRLSSWPQFADLAYSDLTSGLLQTLMMVLKPVNHKLTQILVQKLLDESFAPHASEDTDRKDEKTSEPISMFENNSVMRLLEVAITVSSERLYTQIYVRCFKNRLLVLSKAPIPNFSVQKLLNCCKNEAEFEVIFNELSSNFEEILVSNTTGVLLSLCQACNRLGTHQGEFVKELMKALHCWEPADRQLLVAPLLVRLKPYEVFEAEGTTFPTHLHGSLILQVLLTFKKPIKIVKSIIEMSCGDLEALFTDQKGSHVMDSFMSSGPVGGKSRDKLIRKLQGTFVAMACSKHGSRSMDAIWKVAGLKQKLMIMDEISSREAMLNSTQFGNIISLKFGISLFNHQREEWKSVQTKGDNKRQLFADIIGDLGK